MTVQVTSLSLPNTAPGADSPQIVEQVGIKYRGYQNTDGPSVWEMICKAFSIDPEDDQAFIATASTLASKQYADESAQAAASAAASAEANRAMAAELSLSNAIKAETARAEARESGMPFVTDYGALGDDQTDDTAALAKCVAAGGVFYVPSGTYLISNNTVLMNPGMFFGPGMFSFNGWLFPAGDVDFFVNLNVPSIFPTIQSAINWCEFRAYKGVNGFASINLAGGQYSVAGLEPRFPQGADRIQIVGDTSNPNNVIVSFDATNNQCGFLFQRGSGIYLINGMTINGVGGMASPGVWNAQCYGAGVMAQYNSRVHIGAAVRINYAYYGVSSRYSSSVQCDDGVIVQYAGDVGFHAFGASSIKATACKAFYCADNSQSLGFGFCAESSGFIDCSFGVASHNAVAGFYANNGGSMWAHSGEADNNQYGVYAINGGRIESVPGSASDPKPNVFSNTSHGYYAINGGYINANSAFSSKNGGCGYAATNGGFIDITASSAQGNTSHGYIAYQQGGLKGDNATAYQNGGDGFQAASMGNIASTGLTTNSNGGWGLHAFNVSLIFAANVTLNANNSSGAMSPASFGSVDNNGSYILSS